MFPTKLLERLYEGNHMFQLSFSGTCAHSAALCSSVGVLQGTSELAALPPMSYSLHTKSLDTCAKCCLSVHGTLIFLVAFHCDALRGSDSTDSTDYGHTKSFQENFLEMSQNCIFKWHLEHERLKPSSQQTFPWSWLVVLKMNFVFLGYSWERELLSVAVRLWGRFSFLVLNFGSKESLFISHHYPELFFALFFLSPFLLFAILYWCYFYLLTLFFQLHLPADRILQYLFCATLELWLLNLCKLTRCFVFDGVLFYISAMAVSELQYQWQNNTTDLLEAPKCPEP